MYAQSFFVTSVRGIGFEPTTSATIASGVTGRMKAAFAVRFRPTVFFFDPFAAFLAVFLAM